MKTPFLVLAGLALATSAASQTAIFTPDPVSAVATTGGDTRAIIAADLDGDGDVDLLVGNFAQANDLFENRGDGNFSSIASDVLTTPTEVTFGMTAGDIDGDGDLDLAMANGSGNTNGLYRNNGPPGGPWAGRFTHLSSDPVSAGAADSYAARFVDVDGDGDADLVFANRDLPNFMYLNSGSGSFTEVTTGLVVTENANSRDVTAGDLDGDGDFDLVFANSNDEPNFIYINQGGSQSGTPGSFLRLPFGNPATDAADKSYGATLADIDGDGDLDLFVANRKGQLNGLFTNDGSASFSLAAGQHPSQDAGDSFHGSFGDADQDGDTDLFVANRNEANFLYLNDGGNLLRVSTGPVVADSDDSRLGTFADLDMDGVSELLVGNTSGQSNDLFRNLLSKWVNLGSAFQPIPATPEPRLSAGGSLGTHTWVHYFVEAGPASKSVAFVVGASKINAPFRGGVFVPAPDLVINGFSTDALGQLKMSFVVPGGLPSGFEIFHQAWIVEPASPAGLVATNGLRGITP